MFRKNGRWRGRIPADERSPSLNPLRADESEENRLRPDSSVRVPENAAGAVIHSAAANVQSPELPGAKVSFVWSDHPRRSLPSSRESPPGNPEATSDNAGDC